MDFDPGLISEEFLTLLAALNHEVLVQPKQGGSVVSDDAGAATPERKP